jgi:hypothetical protein
MNKIIKKLKKAILPKSDFGRYVLKHPMKTLKAIFEWCWATMPRRIVSSLVIIVLIFGPISFLFKPGKAEAAWWNDSWAYRKSISIANASGGALVDFQVHALNNTDLSADITAGKYQASLNDIRFTDVNGKVLPYWIEDSTVASVDIWVKIPTIPTSGAVIYMYYGNPQAVAYSDGNKTFEFFDDFNRGTALDTSKWTATGAYSISGGAITITTGAVYTNSKILSSALNYKYEYRAKWAAPSSSYAGLQIADAQYTSGSNGGSNKLAYFMTNNGSLDVQAWAADGTLASYNITGNGPTQYTATADTYYLDGFSIDASKVRYYHEGSQTNEYTGTWSSAPYLWLGYFSGNTSGATDIRDITVDWVRARKYASTDPTPTINTEEKTTGPIAYWAMDEGYSTIVHDNTSNKNDGSLDASTAAPTWKPESECVSGKCLGFDGTNDDVYVNDTGTSLDFTNTSQYTFSSWIKYNGAVTTTQCFLSKDIPGPKTTGFNLCLNQTGSTADINICKGGLSMSCSSGLGLNIPANEWNNIAVTYDGASNWGIYKNGKSAGTINFSVDSDTAAKYYIGAGVAAQNAGNQLPTAFFKGNIDEVKVYPYSRSADQIKMDYNSQMRGSNDGIETAIGGASQKWMTNGLVGNWKMDEASGTAVADASGNANTGTLTLAQETDTATAASTTTLVVPTSGASMSATDDAYNGMILNITGGGGGCGITTGTQRLISDYTGVSKTVTVAPAFAAEADSCTFEIRHQTGGKFGNGLQLDGDNDYVTSPHNASFNAFPITISTWFKTQSTRTNYSIINKYVSGSMNGWGLFACTGTGTGIKLYYFSSGSNYVSNYDTCYGSGYNDNKWHFLTATVDSSGKKIYVDGSYVGGAAWTGTPGAPTSVVNQLFGYYQGMGYYFDESLDDVRIYNRALSPDEISKLYNFAPGPIGQWKFDEKSGSTAYDSSGNGNDGNITCNGASCVNPSYTQGKLGSALSFVSTGRGGTVTRNPLNIIPGSGSAITIGMWIKPPATQTGYPATLVRNGTGSDENYDFYIYPSALKLGFDIYESTWRTVNTAGAVLTANQWNYVSAVFTEGVEVKFYVNGIWKETLAFPYYAITPATTSFNIGGHDGGTQGYSGLIDDVRVYNYARTPEQILEDMQGDVGGGMERIGKPLVQLKFDEGFGATANNSGTGGSTLNGTLTPGGGGTNDTATKMWDNNGKFGKGIELDGTDDYVSVPNFSY